MRPVLAVLLALLGAPARGDDLAARAARSCVLAPAAPAAVAVGERGTVVVVVRCEPGVHLQRQAPLRVAASASPGLAVAKPRLTWEDARVTGDAREVEIPVSFTATAAGAAEVRLRLDFFVCSDEWCVRQERALAVPVAVTAAPAPAPVGAAAPARAGG